MRLTDVTYDDDGEMSYPQHDDTRARIRAVGLPGQGEEICSPPTPAVGRAQPGGVSADFEHLRWFDLPAICVGNGSGIRQR